MIKNIFLPERSGSYYLFSSRTIGITINTGTISAVQVRAKGRKRIIEKVISVPLENTQTDYSDRVVRTLQTIFNQLDRADHVITTLPSVHVVFKKLQIPFVEREKIEQIIAFEVEPLLPFPLNQAVVDFIIIATAADGKSAEVLVAAAQKEAILAHKALFERAGIKSTEISVDILSLYALITTVPAYTVEGGLVLLIIGTNTTCVTLIRDGKLSLIRTLPRGTNHIAKMISSELAITPETASEELVRFGVEHNSDQKKADAIRKALSSYFDEIAFTINSFSSEPSSIVSVLVLGPGSHINGLLPFASDLLHAPCQPLNPQLILDNPTIQFKNGETFPIECIIPLSAALRTDLMFDFDLTPMESEEIDNRLFLKQMLVFVILMLIFFGILSTHYFMQRSKLKKEIRASEQQTVTALKERFTQIESTSLADVVEDAEEEVDKEESTWFAFSSAARASMLTILLELKSKIDKEALGFVLDKLTITEDAVLLKARVKDHPALKLFEQSLKNSSLLKNFEPQRDPIFEMKITLPSFNREET